MKPPAPLVAETVARTHRGCVREVNEDAFVTAPGSGVWAVADGMGGLQAGEVASRTVAEALSAIGPAASAYALAQAAEAALQGANRVLFAYGAETVGSTVVALLAHGGHWACLWAGDSRAYRIRGRRADQLTRDHSLVQELIDSGAMSPAEARRSRRRNVITRAVGVDAALELEMRQGEIAGGDVFLLCSDGLSGLVDEAELAQVAAGGADLDRAADDLIELSLRRGAPDNVTLVLVRFQPAQPAR